jgi:hypothetical protein
VAWALDAQRYAKSDHRKAQRRRRRCLGQLGRAAKTLRARPGDLSADRQTPEALAALQSAEIGKCYPIIKAADIRLE